MNYEHMPITYVSRFVERLSRYAEMFDLHAIIQPDRSKGYHIDLEANIPLEMEGNKPGV